ncbi:Flagellar biosynthetic protein FliQ [Pseudovibrio sp. W64]|jgi:type III secretion protein S|uniref:Type III secretion protein S n=3 Tax=Pseudovibrio TaxID=258255 RepID=A0A1I7BL40_9HYPH|nr:MULTISPECIES: type III secretion system export apparatus subunit SctS [Pseudovibrio]AEV38186.1 Yop proteins translocation protein S [Pseudovibrio sp. FO-BEG1]EEA96652.1 type III secretion protein, HrpO family [Pseudovibrio sp. JE062]KZK76694.1 Flagellar biosynthetic protein FliQ [Pseudovibrio sp. W64]KZK79774.1 Flagellar biosynthetic protein FliQ [Pseudovibrio sp. Ad46]KZK81531.1 Flagellar biosynthetic protein FliQ [Pseudovibrio sp. Ad13]
MSPEDAVYRISEAMILVMMLSLPPIIVASLVGLAVSLLQALTQMQEQTIQFGVKLIAVALTLFMMSSFLGSETIGFTQALFDDFPTLVR